MRTSHAPGKAAGSAVIAAAALMLVVATLLMLLMLLMLLGAAAVPPSRPSPGVNLDALPPLARNMLPVIEEAARPAQSFQRSGSSPRYRPRAVGTRPAYSPATAAGLYQFLGETWTGVGGLGGAWASHPPPDHPVWEPAGHLRIGISFVCGNLRAMSRYLAETGNNSIPSTRWRYARSPDAPASPAPPPESPTRAKLDAAPTARPRSDGARACYSTGSS